MPMREQHRENQNLIKGPLGQGKYRGEKMRLSFWVFYEEALRQPNDKNKALWVWHIWELG